MKEFDNEDTLWEDEDDSYLKSVIFINLEFPDEEIPTLDTPVFEPEDCENP